MVAVLRIVLACTTLPVEGTGDGEDFPTVKFLGTTINTRSSATESNSTHALLLICQMVLLTNCEGCSIIHAAMHAFVM